MDDIEQLKVKVGWVLMHQARFNLTVARLLRKIASHENLTAEDLEESIKYVNLQLERSDEIIALLGIKNDDG